MSGFSLVWITKSFHMSWKYWIMMDYGKTKNSRMRINASIGQSRFMDIDWLISVDSLISTCFTRWFALFNCNPQEQKHHGMIWLIRTQTLKIFWDSVHILKHTLNNYLRNTFCTICLRGWRFQASLSSFLKKL